MFDFLQRKEKAYVGAALESVEAVETALADAWTDYDRGVAPETFEDAFDVSYSHLRSTDIDIMEVAGSNYHAYVHSGYIDADDDPMNATLYREWTAPDGRIGRHLPEAMIDEYTRQDRFLEEQLDRLFEPAN